MTFSTEYYGGHANYDDVTKDLQLTRYCGFFSNITVLMHLLCELKLKRYYPEKIKTDLTEYKNCNVYDSIYNIDLNFLENWKEFDLTRTHRFRFGTAVNLYGFGTSRDQIDLELTSLLINTYFNPSDKVKDRVNLLQKSLNIDTNNGTFVWWRKTDKIREINWYRADAKYPSIEDMLKVVKSDSPIYVQTDDLEIYETLSKNSNITLLNVLPIDKNNSTGFHIQTKSVDNEEFNSLYKQSFEDYLINLVALTVIASRCKKFVGYPGNISLYVSLIRNSFDKVFFFKNHEEFY